MSEPEGAPPVFTTNPEGGGDEDEGREHNTNSCNNSVEKASGSILINPASIN